MDIKIALAGNPNCGKTTLFNALTGSSQYVGNWPGVTVEKKEGRLKGRKDVVIQDLPGIYSLSPYTLEEVVARGYLVNERPDAILNIVDGTNIERNLYLTTQLIELGLPVVVAVNMMGTMVMVIIAILALFLKEGYLVDICLIYAMISFLAVIILTKVYMGVYAECMQHKGGRILRAVPPKSESAQPGAVGIEGTEPEAGGIADILPDKKQCGEEM